MDIIQDATTVERTLMSQASQNRVPINGSIELSPLCNMNCDMCYVRLSREEMEKQGRLRSAEEWLEIAKQMHGGKVLWLYVVGQLFNIALTFLAVWLLLSGVIFEIPVLDLYK